MAVQKLVAHVRDVVQSVFDVAQVVGEPGLEDEALEAVVEVGDGRQIQKELLRRVQGDLRTGLDVTPAKNLNG